MNMTLFMLILTNRLMKMLIINVSYAETSYVKELKKKNLFSIWSFKKISTEKYITFLKIYDFI